MKQFLTVCLKVSQAHVRDGGFVGFLLVCWKFGHFLMVTLSAVGTPKARRLALREQRMGKCRMCPVFDARYNSCGQIPVEWIVKGREMLGCGCWLPLASQIPRKKCWLDVQGQSGGWNEMALQA